MNRTFFVLLMSGTIYFHGSKTTWNTVLLYFGALNSLDFNTYKIDTKW